MATYRPKCDFTPWMAPATQLKSKWDWKKIGVWSGILVFCLAVWVVVILGCKKLV